MSKPANGTGQDKSIYTVAESVSANFLS